METFLIASPSASSIFTVKQAEGTDTPERRVDESLPEEHVVAGELEGGRVADVGGE
jgi:hypothetical protein